MMGMRFVTSTASDGVGNMALCKGVFGFCYRWMVRDLRGG